MEASGLLWWLAGLAFVVTGVMLVVGLVAMVREANRVHDGAWAHGNHCADDVLDPDCRFCQEDTPRGRRLRGQP
jgi:hypothetical protein